MLRAEITAVSFWSTTIGKKTVVGVTGIILYIYVLAHLVGNLLIYGGRSTINGVIVWRFHLNPGDDPGRGGPVTANHDKLEMEWRDESVLRSRPNA